MALLVPNAGEVDMLEAILADDLKLKLYTNDKTPAETDTEADYTEATGSGYAEKTLTFATWTITPGAPTEAAYAAQLFTFSGALGNVYGYYVVDAVSGALRWAERFTDGPYNVTSGADTIEVTPVLEAE